MRVTEKLVKHKRVTILKHSSATVVGWELHPADRLRQDGAERFLHYQPRCIYIKFADATWTVDKRLGAGVWLLSGTVAPLHILRSGPVGQGGRSVYFALEIATPLIVCLKLTLAAERLARFTCLR